MLRQWFPSAPPKKSDEWLKSRFTRPLFLKFFELEKVGKQSYSNNYGIKTVHKNKETQNILGGLYLS